MSENLFSRKESLRRGKLLQADLSLSDLTHGSPLSFFAPLLFLLSSLIIFSRGDLNTAATTEEERKEGWRSAKERERAPISLQTFSPSVGIDAD